MVEMSLGNKRGRPSKGLQECKCGYATEHTSNFKKNRSTCPMVKEDSMLAAKDEIIANLKEQLAAKDAQIKELIEIAKKPRTVNNTNIKVDSNVNAFGMLDGRDRALATPGLSMTDFRVGVPPRPVRTSN